MTTRSYGRVQSCFWSSDDIRHLSDHAKLIALYLLTGPHTTLLGCFRLPDGYAAEDLGDTAEKLGTGLGELNRSGFCDRDDVSKFVLVHRFLRWNKIENPNQAKAAKRLFGDVPDRSPLKLELAQAIWEHCPQYAPQIVGPRKTLSERFGKPFRNQEQEQEPFLSKGEASSKVRELGTARRGAAA